MKNVTTMKMYDERNFLEIPQIKKLSDDQIHSIKVVGSVIPFRVNNYIINNLINWDEIPSDPIYKIFFPQKDMLSEQHFTQVSSCIKSGVSEGLFKRVISDIRMSLNPHPGRQIESNIPKTGEHILGGVQHKYRETVLYFPFLGQTCFSYCTFCFRWAQFIGDQDLFMASRSITDLCEYVKERSYISDILITGGDPLIMRAESLKKELLPLLDLALQHLQNIRIGTRSLASWPQRFIMDKDADDLLRLFEKVIKSGKHLTIVAHYNHWRELETDIAQQAVSRLRDIGVIIRSQSPICARINDDSKTWVRLWNDQVKQGIVPYYMFIPRDTGVNKYFKLSLEKAWQVYKDAINSVSGLAKTVRGPVMSTTLGKIEVLGITKILEGEAFVLRYLQAREPNLIGKPFFAKYNEYATWFSDLKPLGSQDEIFFA